MTKIHRKARAFKKEIMQEFDLNSDELRILDGCVDQLHLYWTASDQLSKDGMTFKTDSGIIRAHPAVGICKNSWQGFLAGCRLLQIGQPADAKNRPGRPTGGSMEAAR